MGACDTAPAAKTTWQCRANRVLVENARFATAAVSRTQKKKAESRGLKLNF